MGTNPSDSLKIRLKGNEFIDGDIVNRFIFSNEWTYMQRLIDFRNLQSATCNAKTDIQMMIVPVMADTLSKYGPTDTEQQQTATMKLKIWEKDADF